MGEIRTHNVNGHVKGYSGQLYGYLENSVSGYSLTKGPFPPKVIFVGND